MGFEAMYNNSVAIAGCDKCQRGTGRKGLETLLVLLPGPGWDIGVAGAGEGSHRQGQAAPLLPSMVGRGASSMLPENRELPVCVSGLCCVPEAPAVLFRRAQAALGAAGAQAPALPAQAASCGFPGLEGCWAQGVFFPVVVALAAAGAPQGMVCPRVCSSCVCVALPAMQTPCLGSCPPPRL